MTAKKKLTAVDTSDDDDEQQPIDEGNADTNGEVKMTDVVFRGATFQIPIEMDEWDTEACLALGAGEYMLAAKLLLGPGQWALLQTLGSKRKDVREFLLTFSAVINEKCVD